MTGEVLNEALGRAWAEFQHEVMVATSAAFSLLGGIRALSQGVPLPAPRTGHAGIGFKVRGYPSVFGDEAMREPFKADGPLERFVLKAWVVEVYDLWESRHRNVLGALRREWIRPEQPVLGDLGLIRNGLVHGGSAKKEHVGKCKVLRWFRLGEPMQVRFRHVMDFLNQMGWLDESARVVGESSSVRGFTWIIDRDSEVEDPPPGLVSVRPLVDPSCDDPIYRYGVSYVFENGVFGMTPMGPEQPESEQQSRRRRSLWKKMRINDDGDLRIPGFQTVPAEQLDRDTLKEERVWRLGPGSPRVRIRR